MTTKRRRTKVAGKFLKTQVRLFLFLFYVLARVREKTKGEGGEKN